MRLYTLLPLLFLRFWFFDAPKEMLVYFSSLNHAFLQLFSLQLLMRTLFKPWKNEYRKGLVGVSIAIGVVVKTFVIIADLIIFFAIIAIELASISAFVLWPLAAVYFLFK